MDVLRRLYYYRSVGLLDGDLFRFLQLETLSD